MPLVPADPKIKNESIKQNNSVIKPFLWSMNTSYELQVTSYYKLRVMSFEFQVTNYELWVTSYELRDTRYEIQGMRYELRVANYKYDFSESADQFVWEFPPPLPPAMWLTSPPPQPILSLGSKGIVVYIKDRLTEMPLYYHVCDSFVRWGRTILILICWELFFKVKNDVFMHSFWRRIRF